MALIESHTAYQPAVEAAEMYPAAQVVWAAIEAAKEFHRLQEEQAGAGVPDTQPEEFYS